ncbi:MAG: hypothetical protein M9916_08845 [Crocinitomicaceae bacterium]|nr:hypothetical protein [Crocinitomicaceae bacterium]
MKTSFTIIFICCLSHFSYCQVQSSSKTPVLENENKTQQNVVNENTETIVSSHKNAKIETKVIESREQKVSSKEEQSQSTKKR